MSLSWVHTRYTVWQNVTHRVVHQSLSCCWQVVCCHYLFVCLFFNFFLYNTINSKFTEFTSPNLVQLFIKKRSSTKKRKKKKVQEQTRKPLGICHESPIYLSITLNSVFFIYSTTVYYTTYIFFLFITWFQHGCLLFHCSTNSPNSKRSIYRWIWYCSKWWKRKNSIATKRKTPRLFKIIDTLLIF